MREPTIMRERLRRVPTAAGPAAGAPEDPGVLLQHIARGDEASFERLYDVVISPVFGLVRRVVRDLAQSEEVVQEVMVELWRTAARYSPERGSGMSWVMTLAHRRAVDRVRSAQSSTDRETTMRLEHEQVRRCLSTLTELQRESIVLAYYGGRTYREVGELLDTPLGTIKTRLRDGLIRLRDCLGVAR
jgi:RNA polymerase sigma-70 factor (ECF subfamily)